MGYTRGKIRDKYLATSQYAVYSREELMREICDGIKARRYENADIFNAVCMQRIECITGKVLDIIDQ